MLIDLKRVRTLFDNPEKIQDSNFLRCEISNRMEERLSLMNIDPYRILDAGCGEGLRISDLKKHFPNGQILEIDASMQMLIEAKKQNKSYGTDLNYVCGNFASMPFASNIFDMIWSNLALHWHTSPETVFKEWKRTLNHNGLLIFSCFGIDTLANLRNSFIEVDHYPHIMSFQNMHDLGDMLIATGFSTPVLEREKVNVIYTNIEKLISDVRSLGGNALLDRRKGLLGKHQFSELINSLEKQRDDEGHLNLQFDVIYAHAFKDDAILTGNDNVVRFYG